MSSNEKSNQEEEVAFRNQGKRQIREEIPTKLPKTVRDSRMRISMGTAKKSMN